MVSLFDDSADSSRPLGHHQKQNFIGQKNKAVDNFDQSIPQFLGALQTFQELQCILMEQGITFYMYIP